MGIFHSLRDNQANNPSDEVVVGGLRESQGVGCPDLTDDRKSGFQGMHASIPPLWHGGVVHIYTLIGVY